MARLWPACALAVATTGCWIPSDYSDPYYKNRREKYLAEAGKPSTATPPKRRQKRVDPPPLAPVGQRWAVIVGVSQHCHAGTGGLKNLRFADRDAKALYDGLVGSDPVRWPKENVQLLTDEKATEKAVRKGLLTFLKKAQENDLVLIFLSGHGSPDPERPTNSYFLCHDTDPKDLTGTGLPMWEIENALEKGIIEARRVLVLADACHSGGFAPDGMKDIRVVSEHVVERLESLGTGTLRRVVTSCRAGELSQEKADWGGGHGAFAHALCLGLAGAADRPTAADKNANGNGDRQIDLDELVHYVRRTVGDLTSNAQHVRDTGRLNAVLMRK